VDPDGGTSLFGYDADGRETSLAQPNGVQSSYAYDARNRLVTISTHRADGSPVFTGQYAYDGADNRTQVQENGETIDLTSDVASRLTQAQLADRTIGYAYDADGNRLSLGDSAAGTTTYTYDAADRLISSSGADAASYTYDAKGNRLSRSDGSGTTAFTYGP